MYLETGTGSLPVWEEWIEMGSGDHTGIHGVCLFPYGKSGLKYFLTRGDSDVCRLFPYGKSGLKYEQYGALAAENRLFPYGKSGLKSTGWPSASMGSPSLPVWEEWIEITTSSSTAPAPPGLFPYGKSGLK